VETGYSRRAAGRHFDVSASFVMKFMARVRVTGSIEPARQGRPPGKGKLAPFALFLGTRVDAEPDITMPELAGALFEAHGIRVSPAALSRFLIREGYSYKKNADRNRTRSPKGQAGARCVGDPPSTVDAA